MYKRTLSLLIIPLLVLLCTAQRVKCSTHEPVYTGIASFYSDCFHGRKTANGERYDRWELTAAHRSLPMGTVVRVTNVANGRHLLVRINDRGPYKKSWLLDVSREAASRLKMIRRGITPVHMEVLTDKHGYPVQHGTAFFLKVTDIKNQSEGTTQVAALRNLAHRAGLTSGKHHSAKTSARLFEETTPKGKNMLFLGLGPFPRYSDALNARDKIKKYHPKTEIIHLPLAVAMRH